MAVLTIFLCDEACADSRMDVESTAAMMTQWLAYIRLFDFEARHVSGERNGEPDALSRCGRGAKDRDDEDVKMFFLMRSYMD